MDKPTRKYEIETEIEASPEQLWDAVTQGDQLMAWFAPEVKVTPGVGGSITMSWGPGMEATAPIRVWEPGKRAAWVEGEGSEYPKTIEFQIEAKDGGTSILRLVHSGFGGEGNFENEFDSYAGGWRTFFAMLKYGIGRLAKAKALNVAQLQMGEESKAVTWERLLKRMELSSLAEGSEYTAKFGEFALKGRVVRHVKAGYLCLSVESLEDSLLALFVEGGKKAMVTFEWILYGETKRYGDQALAAIKAVSQEICAAEPQ